MSAHGLGFSCPARGPRRANPVPLLITIPLWILGIGGSSAVVYGAYRAAQRWGREPLLPKSDAGLGVGLKYGAIILASAYGTSAIVRGFR